MKTNTFFQKEMADKNNSSLSFTKKFDENSINSEIDQNYQKIVEILEVNNMECFFKLFPFSSLSTKKSKKY